MADDPAVKLRVIRAGVPLPDRCWVSAQAVGYRTLVAVSF